MDNHHAELSFLMLVPAKSLRGGWAMDRPHPSQACIQEDTVITHLKPPNEGRATYKHAAFWMQMLCRWAKRVGRWGDSPRTETPGGNWLAAYVREMTTCNFRLRNDSMLFVRCLALDYNLSAF
ncbi:hypothetical protein DPMN_096567 [Dreissena polymorpha]|uniref:Uncharacterized protein n=1 Tax=Dreissena polymorpha TaxID=45954 RepID=A0A9D4LA02_DREPO|nr:hypothetical protein DPMN_096567 [Dreissena polymorpha]